MISVPEELTLEDALELIPGELSGATESIKNSLFLLGGVDDELPGIFFKREYAALLEQLDKREITPEHAVSALRAIEVALTDISRALRKYEADLPTDDD